MLNRRKFIWYTLAGTGGLLMGFRYLTKITNFEQVLSDLLLRNLDGLKINPAEIDEYARDVATNNALNLSFANTQLLCMYQMMGTENFLMPFNRKYNRLCTDITANFLLSTDFHLNKMDEQRAITYSGSIYNMYKGACRNPFSGLFYKD